MPAGRARVRHRDASDAQSAHLGRNLDRDRRPGADLSADDLRALAELLVSFGWNEALRQTPVGYRGTFAELEAVYDRHQRSAFSLAARLLGDRAQAEEVVQVVFLAVWRSPARYDSRRGSEHNWILSIIRNRVIDMLRARGWRPLQVAHASELEHMAGADSFERITAHVDGLNVHLALESLPVEQRQVLELAYFEELSQREIAELTCHLARSRGDFGLASIDCGDFWATRIRVQIPRHRKTDLGH